ncbi:hypothetical protein [Paenibacillus eucommiae]|uniref:Cytoskeletal protein RodZ n=1 Tax=Paenibacillus eucommiae TaxID=1355755 RepID=A0ABS4J0R0_9BACL|nr:hypothetical protein [Paenibacillus eucommiae]MBP1993427.1 cytoskeletal protein RodZ [Paenibacillus eucommiae]
MQKKKWKKWLIWSGSVLIVLLIVGYIGMNMAVSYTLKSLVPSEVEALLETTPNPTENSSEQNGEGGDPISSGGQTDEGKKPEGGQEAGNGVDNNSPDSSTDPSPTASSKPSSETSKPSSKPASPSPTPKGQKLEYQAEVTKEKAKDVESAISLKDKLSVTTVLLKKLSASDIQLISKMAGNGLSIEDKKAAKKIIMEKLTEDEYDHLIQIAAKYGLSQGKTYKETSK